MVSVERLSVTTPQGRCLLNRVSLTISQGEFVLLAGASGSGKTVLLRLIAGLDVGQAEGMTIEGDVQLRGDSGSATEGTRVGVVFQDLALFDELSPLDNVRFAMDHARRRRSASDSLRRAAEFLEVMEVDRRTRLSALSGGERQRVAVARVLALEPPLILFDEPTTGLDPVRAQMVAALIARTSREADRTVVVVSHDYRPFLPHQPRIVLLDSTAASLRDVDAAGLDRHFSNRAEALSSGVAAGDKGVDRPLSSSLETWLRAPGAALWTLLTSVVAAVSGFRLARWKLRFLWHYAKVVVLGASLPFVLIAGAMLGFVFVFFSFSQIPYGEVMVPLLKQEFLNATGYSMFRVVVPIMIGVLLAAYAGAALAADIGTRRLTNQLDALRTFGASPSAYLYGNMVIALALGVPLLTMVAYGSNCLAALVAFLMTSPEATPAVFRRHYFSLVWPSGRALPAGAGWVLVKMLCSGLVIAALSYRLGSLPKRTSADVGRDVRWTIFFSCLSVLLLHAFFAFLEF